MVIRRRPYTATNCDSLDLYASRSHFCSFSLPISILDNINSDAKIIKKYLYSPKSPFFFDFWANISTFLYIKIGATF